MIKSSNKPKIMLALGQPYCLATDIRDGLFYRVFFLSQSRTKRNLNKQAKNSIINGPVYLFISIYNKTFLFFIWLYQWTGFAQFSFGILSFPLYCDSHNPLFFFFDDKFLLMWGFYQDPFIPSYPPGFILFP